MRIADRRQEMGTPDGQHETRIPDRRQENRRKERRLAVSLRGTLKYQEAEFRCLIQDMSGCGFFVVCAKPFLPRQILKLRCELYPSRFFECTVEIRHVDDAGFGTMIVEMDERAKMLLTRFLAEHYSDELSRGTR